ncbi:MULTISPECIES: hypothetical protein [Brucella]|uniref:Uncharacterized protein n=2 Tax=Ochrobactrum TaxID=528 RepID=A0ABD5JU75_9HYPH|nr:MULTISPECIES: hypothetical protein [Brucella]MCI1001366.1 hypothetical protein [Ochrobactrum sp. C6C9]WHT42344.1 hypothetical protein QLQ11_02060 [Ochrobactrum sp. SSR]MDX4074400.1 hypothetical protein [Brucella sp. NBRC 113783]WHS31204.1 hypothetical protein QLQ09_15385 [Brucella sp. NM4]SPL65640.1 hypothetical protein OHAE_1507 [[Ochrobactrum] soli]
MVPRENDGFDREISAISRRLQRNNLSGEGRNAGFLPFGEETWPNSLDETSLKTYQQPI